MPPRKRVLATIAATAPDGDRLLTLRAIRDRLALETDDLKWAQHKRECRCTCGITNPAALVALVKELRAVEAEMAGLPSVAEVSDLDRLADELAPRRAVRRTAPAGGKRPAGDRQHPGA